MRVICQRVITGTPEKHMGSRLLFLALCVMALGACYKKGASSDAGLVDAGVGDAQPECERTPAPESRYRLFAVGHRVTLDQAVSMEDFKEALYAIVEAEVVPHLATDRPNLVVFPEDVGLVMAFSGARGQVARAQPNVQLAFLNLVGPYREAMDHYLALDSSLPLGRQLMLATTDPVWRAFHETFSAMAAEYGIYVAASTNVGDVEVVADPVAAATLGDPERPEGAPVYWVPDLKVYNQSVVWGPDGAILGHMRKEYLVDLEIQDLAMTGGLPETLGPLVAEGGMRLTAMISRDAWMQDALERLALGGADVILQHEAFASVWASMDSSDLWTPDNLKRSGWAAVQKHPEYRYAAAPMLVGNLFEIPFDGQTFIAEKGHPDRRDALLAQEPDVGWAAIAPWVMDAPEGTLQEQREALMAAGRELLPGGAQAGGYRVGVVWVDVDIPGDDGYLAHPGVQAGTVLGPSVAIAPSGLGRQRSVAPAVVGDSSIMVLWEDTRFCTGQIVFSRSLDDGDTWSPPVRVAPSLHPQRTPVVVVLGDGAVVAAWQEVLGDGRAEIRLARSDEGVSFEPPLSLEPDKTVEAWKPSLAHDPSTDHLHLAFVDARDGPPNRRVFVTRSEDRGETWRPSRRLDRRSWVPADLDVTYTTEWSPSIAVQNGRVLVAYSHRQRPLSEEQPSHDVFLMESLDGGDSWGSPTRLDPHPAHERIGTDIVVMATQSGYRVLFSSLRGTAYHTDVAMATGDDGDLRFVPDVVPGRDQWFPAVAPLGNGAVVLWQDLREGSSHIYLSHLSDDGVFGEPQRVDDGVVAARAWRPKVVTLSDGRILAFWEDSRSGQAEIRVARGALDL